LKLNKEVEIFCDIAF